MARYFVGVGKVALPAFERAEGRTRLCVTCGHPLAAGECVECGLAYWRVGNPGRVEHRAATGRLDDDPRRVTDEIPSGRSLGTVDRDVPVRDQHGGNADRCEHTERPGRVLGIR